MGLGNGMNGEAFHRVRRPGGEAGVEYVGRMQNECGWAIEPSAIPLESLPTVQESTQAPQEEEGPLDRKGDYLYIKRTILF